MPPLGERGDRGLLPLPVALTRQHKLDLCALTDTLIADADGVYHPAGFNDRLVLGLKVARADVTAMT